MVSSAVSIVVFCSGSASSFRWLWENDLNFGVHYKVVGVFSDKPGASGLAYAKEHGFPTACTDYRKWCQEHGVNWKDLEAREPFFAEVLQTIAPWKPEAIMLSGCMLILTNPLLRAFWGRIFNVHPALWELSSMGMPVLCYALYISSMYPITALDGRYQKNVTELSGILSEFGLMKYRVQIEVAWLFFLKERGIIPANVTFESLRNLAFSDEHYKKIKELETTTRHDVKAVEYFLREHTDKNTWPWIHFACTSEDINNIAYVCQLRDARRIISSFLLGNIVSVLADKAQQWKAEPMLARTHGQPATPTTMGKEVAVFVHRLKAVHERMESVELTAKFNGASGNFAAHVVAFPEENWIEHSKIFVESLGFKWNPLTTQIENHDTQVELLDHMAHLCSILSDLCTDMWGYISIGYFGQKIVEGEVGSSTMPHKVNPIDFENARGNFKLARGIARTLSDELPISMWQRDLTDSTLQRNFGLVFGHLLVGLKSLEKGLGKIELRSEALRKDLVDNPEVLTEAIQVVLRKNGHADAYEQLKELSRGKRITLEDIRAFVKKLDIAPPDKERLLALTPAMYVGNSQKLAEGF